MMPLMVTKAPVKLVCRRGAGQQVPLGEQRVTDRIDQGALGKPGDLAGCPGVGERAVPERRDGDVLHQQTFALHGGGQAGPRFSQQPHDALGQVETMPPPQGREDRRPGELGISAHDVKGVVADRKEPFLWGLHVGVPRGGSTQ